MKKLILMALLMVMSVTAKALSYQVARSEALFLSDKMAYELNLSPSQYEAIYEINLDYFLYVGSSLDLYTDLWKQRNFEIQRVLTPYQFEEFLRLKYFYRPLGWRDGRWEFRIYRVYPNRRHYMMNPPRAYGHYQGGSHFGGRPGARPGGPNARPGGPNRVGPAPRGDRRPGGGQIAPPRSNNLRGTAPRPRPSQGRATPNGMVQRQSQAQRPPQTQRPPQGQRPQQGQRPPQGQRSSR